MSEYDTDVVQWSMHQAALLRRLAAGEAVNEEVDWPNIIDEVETVGRSERAALRSHIAIILEHLMKLQASPSVDPRKGWRMTIGRARVEVTRVLDESPSLRREVEAHVSREHLTARRLVALALDEYGEEPRVSLDSLTYTTDEVLSDWYPDATPSTLPAKPAPLG